jgi:hypothetical protein
MNNQIIQAEVEELAKGVEVKKRQEIENLLSAVFTSTNDWMAEVDKIKVETLEDKEGMRKADELRKVVKKARIQYEKKFDEKRKEVQALMSSFKLEDVLYLKAKQIMQITLKAVEEKAEYKATFIERYEAEQLRMKIALRLEKIQRYDETITENDIASMSDIDFDMFLSSVKEAYEAEQKRIEEERIRAERLEEERIKEQERIKEENKRLKAEVERQLAEIEKARKEKEMVERKIREKEEAIKRQQEVERQAYHLLLDLSHKQ